MKDPSRILIPLDQLLPFILAIFRSQDGLSHRAEKEEERCPAQQSAPQTLDPRTVVGPPGGPTAYAHRPVEVVKQGSDAGAAAAATNSSLMAVT